LSVPVVRTTEPRVERRSAPPRGPVAWWLLAAVAIGAALRFGFLSQQSLWTDEAATRHIVLAPSIRDVWPRVRATESTPPLSYWLMWLLAHAAGSRSDAILRLVPAVAGTLTIPAAYAALRRPLGARVALALAWMCAVSPVLLWYSLDARSYALFVLLGMLNVWALVAALERPDTTRCALWTATAVLCVWTHYFAVFLVVGELLFVVIATPNKVRARLLASAGAVAVLCAPLLPLVSSQTSDNRASFIANLTLSARLEQLVRQFGMGPNVPSAGLEGAGLLLAGVGLVVGAIAVARRNPRSALLLALVAGVTAAIPLALTVTGIDRIFYMRNLLVVWPIVAGVAAVGLLRAHALPFIAYLGLCVATFLLIQANWRLQNPDWAAVAAPLRAQLGSTPALVYPGVDAGLAGIYLDRSSGPGPVRTRRLGVIVEPARTTGRGLQALPQYPGAAPPGLTLRHTLSLPDGFRLLLYGADRRQSISSTEWPPDRLHEPPLFISGPPPPGEGPP
jgi:uncharacterized membrane protein